MSKDIEMQVLDLNGEYNAFHPVPAKHASTHAIGGSDPLGEKPEGNSYLTFSSPNEFTIAVNNASKNWDGILEYYKNGVWVEWGGTSEIVSQPFYSENVIYLRGAGNTVITGTNSNHKWVLTGTDIKCIGNIESLLNYTTVESGGHPTMANYCYYRMFSDCASLIQAPTLSAVRLANNCYSGMFRNCTSLTQSPALPAVTLASECYYNMFSGCCNLTQAPALPATTLMYGCYASMFNGCISLTETPVLPATTLAMNCYMGMFSTCTSLVQAPALPATTLAAYCYSYMFNTCTSLTQVPILPATTFAQGCYSGMFYNCTKIKLSSIKTEEYVKAYCIPNSGTGETATDALTDMFANTGGDFIGTPEINTTYYLSSGNSIIGEVSEHIINEDIHVTVNQKKAWNSSISIKDASYIHLPSDSNWYSIAYGERLSRPYYVALAYGENSTIGAYSIDGIIWKEMIVPSGNWFDVTYGNLGIKEGKFVAISSDNSDIAMYYDIYSGPGWTTTTLPVSASWQSVTFGSDKFVAVAYGTSIAAYSEDGITWNQTTLPSSDNWRSVTYGNGMFVAVAKGSSAVAYSSDGINWTASNLPTSADWISVTYGDNKFVAVAYNGEIAAYSNDGIEWQQANLPSSANWISVVYGCGGFVTIANNSNIVAFSPDGIVWQQISLPGNKEYPLASREWRSMTCGKIYEAKGRKAEVIMAVAANSNYIVWTYNNITWRYQTKAELQTAGGGMIITEEVKEIVNGIPSSIIEQNTGTVQKFWRGTTIEYEDITDKDSNTIYIVSDNKDAPVVLPTAESDGKISINQLPTLFHVGDTTPGATNLLWIDTTGITGGLKYYNGSEWVHVPVAYN